MGSLAPKPLLKQRWLVSSLREMSLLLASRLAMELLAGVETAVLEMAVLEMVLVEMALRPSGLHQRGFPTPVVGSRQSNV